MDRIHDILNSVNETLANAAQKTYKGQKRSELKDSDFLFPETRSFPIVTPQDIPDAISNFGRMKGQMSYEAFLRKLYNMAKRKGPEFVAALPEASKKQLGLKSQAEDMQEDETPEMEMQEEMQEYKDSYYGMSIGSLKAIASHAMDILNNLENPTVKENLTAAHLQGMIAVAEDHLRSIHDFVMFVDQDDDTEESDSAVMTVEPQKEKKKTRVRIKDLPHYTYYSMDEDEEDMEENNTMSADKPGLWDNIRKKKEKMGKNYRPAKPGQKDRPDPEQWKKLTE
jgi:hypothetical protein